MKNASIIVQIFVVVRFHNSLSKSNYLIGNEEKCKIWSIRIMWKEFMLGNMKFFLSEPLPSAEFVRILPSLWLPDSSMFPINAFKAVRHIPQLFRVVSFVFTFFYCWLGHIVFLKVFPNSYCFCCPLNNFNNNGFSSKNVKG